MTRTFDLEFGETLQVLYFTDVSNMDYITDQITASEYPFIHCTCINPRLIFDAFQIAVAANKAVISKNSNNMITKSLPTELLFNLSISENISTSLEKFGYGTRCGSSLLLAIFCPDSKLCEDIKNVVKGTMQSKFLCEPSNVNLIKETYDITDEQLSSSSLLNLIVTKIACKSI